MPTVSRESEREGADNRFRFHGYSRVVRRATTGHYRGPLRWKSYGTPVIIARPQSRRSYLGPGNFRVRRCTLIGRGRRPLHANLRSRGEPVRRDRGESASSRAPGVEKLSRSFLVPGRKASRRRASFAEHTTRFDSLAPSAPTRFRAATHMCMCA